MQRLNSIGAGVIAFHTLVPETELFVKFDPFFQPWDPEKDALRIAADMVNGAEDGMTIKELAESVWMATAPDEPGRQLHDKPEAGNGG